MSRLRLLYCRGEQGNLHALRRCGGLPVALGEAGDGHCLAAFNPLIEPFGDADGLVVVADFGLVVPEHRQSVEPTDAFEAGVEDLSAAAAYQDERFPGVPEPAVVDVERFEVRQVGRVGQGPGDIVGERRSTPRWGRGPRHRDDEAAVQPDLVRSTGLQCFAQDAANTHQDGREGSSSGD
ncbi:hypothetical protein [Streptomyces sp. NPDC091278]|uniref:hypothetical protein n=1 Tax=Streptomyces sp. NPDC091278 TaxID=3155301 RepID=UPI00344F2A2F